MAKYVCDFHLPLDIKAVGVHSHQVGILDDLERVDLSCFDAFNLVDFGGKTVSQLFLDGVNLVENCVLLNHYLLQLYLQWVSPLI